MLKPIGFIDSCYRDRFAVPRQPLLVQDAWAFIRFEPFVQPELSLQGLEGFSHLWVIFGFHLNQAHRFHAKVHPPRLQGESIGLFATRTPHRPNPIGLSVVKIKAITSEGIEILGGDFAHQTPVYDVKPYMTSHEALLESQEGWTKAIEKPLIKVEFQDVELKQKIFNWSQKIGVYNLERIIVETIQQDPRPLVYRDQRRGYKESHAFRLFNGDIHFKVIEDETALVFDIKINGQ